MKFEITTVAEFDEEQIANDIYFEENYDTLMSFAINRSSLEDYLKDYLYDENEDDYNNYNHLNDKEKRQLLRTIAIEILILLSKSVNETLDNLRNEELA